MGLELVISKRIESLEMLIFSFSSVNDLTFLHVFSQQFVSDDWVKRD